VRESILSVAEEAGILVGVDIAIYFLRISIHFLKRPTYAVGLREFVLLKFKKKPKIYLQAVTIFADKGVTILS
jgi:hypothetical protein